MILLHFTDGRSIKLSSYASKKIYPFIENYIYGRYKQVFEKYYIKKRDGNGIEKNCPIFMLWWQGIVKCPSIIKVCVDSVKKNAKEHPVYLIDKYNISSFIEVPEFMLEGVANKRIELPNFSDWVRASLLSKYGGYWIDATTIMFDQVDNCFLPETTETEKCVHFWSVKTGLEQEWCASMGKWSVSYLAAEKGSRLMGLIAEVMQEYFKEHTYAPLYLFLDCLIRTAYHHNPDLQEQIDDIPINNVDTYKLQSMINEPYVKENFPLNGMAKLNWKAKMKEYTDGILTNYGYIQHKLL